MFVKICRYCAKKFESHDSTRQFCSLSCSSTFNNKKRGPHTKETNLKISVSRKGKATGNDNPSKRPEVREKISSREIITLYGRGDFDMHMQDEEYYTNITRDKKPHPTTHESDEKGVPKDMGGIVE